MKTFLMGGTAAFLGLVVGGVAMAADLPARRGNIVAPVLAPAFTWTGFYVGANAGYAFNDNKAGTVGTAGFLGLAPNIPASLNTGKDGFTGGAQIGFNYQLGAAVFGIETDLQYIDGKRRSSFTAGGITTAAGSELTYLGTLRARIGFSQASG